MGEVPVDGISSYSSSGSAHIYDAVNKLPRLHIAWLLYFNFLGKGNLHLI